MGPARPLNAMEVWQDREKHAVMQQAETLRNTIEVMELIDPPKKRKLTRVQRRAIQAELDKTRAKVKGLLMKGNMLTRELGRAEDKS